MTHKNIVLYSVGALGDLLVTTATLYSISLLFPHANQTLIGNALWRNILVPSQWPKISCFIECDRKNFSNLVLYKPNLADNTWEKISEITSLPKFLKNYSIGINLHLRSSRFLLFLLRAKVPIRVGSHKYRFSRFFYTHFVIDDKIGHKRNQYLNVLSSLNKDFTKQQKEYWKIHGLPPLKKYEPERFKEKFGSNFILINPTASIREKAWNAKNFKILVNTLGAVDNLKVIVIGAPHELNWLQEVATDQAQIYYSNSLFDIYDLISAAQLFITNTSSLQFIAASTHTLTITLMGSANASEWGPLGKNDCVIQSASSTADDQIKKNRKLNKVERAKQLEQVAYNRITISQVLEKIRER